MILTVNSGSSSIRLLLFEVVPGGMEPVADLHRNAGEAPPREVLEGFLREHPGPLIGAAHRVVHGGPDLSEARRLDDAVLAEIERLGALAPLHNPPAVEWIRTCRDVLGPDVPQVAVFDTAFFARLPPVARSYALPAEAVERLGLRRYGFHGLAHRALWRRWCALRPELERGGRAITVQLGAGCSMAAIERGEPQDTSMGFSPLEGLVMATRSGDVDPGVLTYWQRRAGLDAGALEQALNRESGLLGLSGISGDMKTLLDSPEPAAAHAVAVYAHRVRKYLGAYMAVLGGCDGVVFGGGVGEHAPTVRARILVGMGWCGLHLDPAANAGAVGTEAQISAPDSPVAAYTVPVDEARVLAEEALAVLRPAGAG